MILVLNTVGAAVPSERIRALLPDNGSDVEVIDTSDMKIAHCIGCNQCWLKTPGICAIKDDYEGILKRIVAASDLYVVSDTRFGFLDSKGKRVLDRIMPVLNMYLEYRNGQMRHQLRYHPLNMGLFYQGAGNQELLDEWCVRCASNLGGRSLGAVSLEKEGTPCM